MAAKRVGVLLAGCGWLDGAEIQEAVCTLLALDQRGANVVYMAPDVGQMHVVDHQSESPSDESPRNVLKESARITRGNVLPVSSVQAADLDALVVPGGFGAAKNLCDFAVNGTDMSVHSEVARLIKDMHAAGKPQGFICIAPALAAKVLGAHGVQLTIGTDEGTADALRSMGAHHINVEPGGIHVDEANHIVSTPAYMLGPNISAVHQGIDALVEHVMARIT